MSNLGSRNEAYDFDVNSSVCGLSSSRLLALSVRCGFRTDHWVIVPSNRSTNHAIVNGSSSNRVGWLQTALQNVPFPFGPLRNDFASYLGLFQKFLPRHLNCHSRSYESSCSQTLCRLPFQAASSLSAEVVAEVGRFRYATPSSPQYR